MNYDDLKSISIRSATNCNLTLFKALKDSRTYQHFSSIDSNGLLCITQQNGRDEIFFEVMAQARRNGLKVGWDIPFFCLFFCKNEACANCTGWNATTVIWLPWARHEGPELRKIAKDPSLLKLLARNLS